MPTDYYTDCAQYKAALEKNLNSYKHDGSVPLEGQAKRYARSEDVRPDGAEIYSHLTITAWETVLAFAVGSLLGLIVSLWLALSPLASALADPCIKAMNAMPRVILAPIFAVGFGLGVLSKVALGVTLVFFIVFFNVNQGVKEVSPVVLANARMLGASRR